VPSVFPLLIALRALEHREAPCITPPYHFPLLSVPLNCSLQFPTSRYPFSSLPTNPTQPLTPPHCRLPSHYLALSIIQHPVLFLSSTPFPPPPHTRSHHHSPSTLSRRNLPHSPPSFRCSLPRSITLSPSLPPNSSPLHRPLHLPGATQPSPSLGRVSLFAALSLHRTVPRQNSASFPAELNTSLPLSTSPHSPETLPTSLHSSPPLATPL